MKAGNRLIRTSATFSRETMLNGAHVLTVVAGERRELRAEIHNAFQLPMILGALRLNSEDEAKVIRAANAQETITVEGRTTVSDLLCAGFEMKAARIARTRAA